MPKYQSTKTYSPEQGFSCCFRQWRAQSHCAMIHGYALGFRFTFECGTLDANSWCVDFGGLKGLKKALAHMFDHTLVIAEDDPERGTLQNLENWKLADVRVVPNTGCESFAKEAYYMAVNAIGQDVLWDSGRVRVVSCECFEHVGNSAIYYG